MDENAKPQVGDQIGGYIRDTRKWDELPLEVRLNRLRDAIRDLRRSLGYMADVARQAKGMAEQHEHGTDGTPLFKAHTLRGDSISAGSMRDDLA